MINRNRRRGEIEEVWVTITLEVLSTRDTRNSWEQKERKLIGGWDVTREGRWVAQFLKPAR